MPTRDQIQSSEAERIAGQLKLAIDTLMGTEAGGEFLWWLLSVGKALNYQPFNESAARTAFACGEMQVGTQILAQICAADPAYLTRLMTASAERQSTTQAALETALAKEQQDD